jgi:alpha-N-arabinofuranosidase
MVGEMTEGRIFCSKHFKIGEIDPRLYGSFVEHMGRVVYTGIYEPEHPDADEEGFRRDVLRAVRDLGVTAVRYPGGNFVSTYQWEDGVGPKAERPRRLDLAWRAIETNEFGTDEFVHWADKADVRPIFTVNLGTRGIQDAVQYLEYCNFPKGTKYSDLRRAHGVEEPYGIKMWCLGNEMDGEWQMGHKTAYEYGRLAAETGKAMKVLDPEIELIACGSSLSNMPTCPEWDLTVMEETYDVADYIALHQYYGGQEKGTKAFLAQTLDMEEYIKTLRAAAQIIKKKKHSAKDMKFSVDEWGIWAVPSQNVKQEVSERPWQIAPPISEQIYTLEDALLFAGMQMVMLRNADAVKIACQSLLTNVSACIMTEPGGGLWLQTIYYPFYYFANYARGTVLACEVSCDTYDCEEFDKVPYLDSLVVWNEAAQEIAVFLINKSETEAMDVEILLEGFAPKEVKKSVVLTAEDKKMTNVVNHKAVVPREKRIAEVNPESCIAKLAPLSFNMVLIGL